MGQEDLDSSSSSEMKNGLQWDNEYPDGRTPSVAAINNQSD